MRDIHATFDNKGNASVTIEDSKDVPVPNNNDSDERVPMDNAEVKAFIEKALSFAKGVAAFTPTQLDDSVVNFVSAFATQDWFINGVSLLLGFILKKDAAGFEAAVKAMAAHAEAK